MRHQPIHVALRDFNLNSRGVSDVTRVAWMHAGEDSIWTSVEVVMTEMRNEVIFDSIWRSATHKNPVSIQRSAAVEAHDHRTRTGQIEES